MIFVVVERSTPSTVESAWNLRKKNEGLLDAKKLALKVFQSDYSV